MSNLNWVDLLNLVYLELGLVVRGHLREMYYLYMAVGFVNDLALDWGFDRELVEEIQLVVDWVL